MPDRAGARPHGRAPRRECSPQLLDRRRRDGGLIQATSVARGADAAPQLALPNASPESADAELQIGARSLPKRRLLQRRLPPEDGGLGAEGNDSEALAAALVCIPMTVAATTRDVMVEVRTDSPNRLAFPAPVHVHLPRHP
jgi:hypothetical protein